MKPVNIKENIKEKVEKLQAEAEATNSLLADLPADLPEVDSLCWHNSSLSEFGITNKVNTLEEAKEKINQWMPYILPLQFQRGTFTSFRTSQHKPENNVKTTENIFPVTVKVSQWNLTFEFYAMIKDHLVSVDIEFEFRAGFEQFARVSWKTELHYEEKYVKDVYLHSPAFSTHKEIKWASAGNEYPNSYTMYWQDKIKFEDMFKK